MLMFIDGSVDPKSKIGYGSCLLITDDHENITTEFVQQEIRSKRFSSTSSTRLEAQTLLWALEETKKILKDEAKTKPITIFSDSQNLVGLPGRREKLQAHHFKTVTGDKDLNNADLYKSIFNILDHMNCRFIKVSGHTKFKKRNKMERIFVHVDRSSRKALRRHKK